MVRYLGRSYSYNIVVEHAAHTSLHHVFATQRDGSGSGVQVGPVHHRALQPLDPARRLSRFKH